VNSDWNASSGVAQILNKPDMSLYALISSLSTVAMSGSYLDLTDLPTISNVPAVTSSDDGKVLKASYSGGTGSYSWETAPSGLPASTSADEGKVLKVDANGDPEWDTAPASQVQADWTESDTTDPSYIQNKPVEQTLVAGTNVTITEANNQVTIGASFTQVQADWNESDTTDPSYIQNKPAIPTVELFEAVYGTTSYADIVAAITAKKIVYCNVAVSGATRMAVFAYQSSTKVEFQYYRSGNGVPDSVFIYSIDSSDAWTTTERPASCVVLSYGTSTWNDFLAAYQKNSVVFCSVVPYNQAYRYAHLAFISMSSSTSNRYAEFWFVRSIGTHDATNQGDQVFVYTLKYDNTWTTTTREMVLQAVAGNGITRTVTTAAGAGKIAWSVKPAANGGVNVDSNGVSVDVKEAPSDDKEYVRKNGAWVAQETVLYSGSRTANAALSETPINFEYLRVSFQYDTSKPKAVVLIDPIIGTQVVTYVKGINTWTTYLQLTLSASAITTDNSKSISFGGMNSGTPEIASVSLDSTEDIGSIVKVVGVNRIASN
jgi:hypothetical protein